MSPGNEMTFSCLCHCHIYLGNEKEQLHQVSTGHLPDIQCVTCECALTGIMQPLQAWTEKIRLEA